MSFVPAASSVSWVFCSSSRNTGVSSIFDRRYIPTRPSGPATRKGTRQPQEFMASSPRVVMSPNISSAPPLKPASVPTSRKLPKKPRRRSGAYSAMNVAAPPYSPPVEKPWTIRRRYSRIGAAMPMLA